jgi:hypothetical protein
MKLAYSTTFNFARSQQPTGSQLCWIAVLVLGSACGHCRAVVIDAHWLGGFSTNWDDAQNWDTTDLMGNPIVPDNNPGFDPTRTYNVIIDGPGSVFVNHSAFHNQDIHDFNNLAVGAGDTISLPGGELQIDGDSVTNNGLIAVGAGTGTGHLWFYQDVTLSGSGAITLGGHPSSELVGKVINTTITNQAGHTISGGGKIFGTGLQLINSGNIIANLSGQPLELLTSVTNNGIMRATNGAALDLKNGAVANTGHEIVAEHASTVEIGLGGVQLTGGTLRTTGTGIIRFYGAGHVPGTTRIKDITLASGSHMQLVKGSGQAIGAEGTFTNDGLVELMGPEVEMRLFDDFTLNGTGVFKMQFNPGSRAFYDATASLKLTNDVGHTIEGTGKVDNIRIDNRGLILANVRTTHGDRDLAIENAGAMNSNSGTIRASNRARIHLQSTTFTNTGTFEALDGGWIKNISLTNLSVGTLTGGTYRAVDSGNGATLNAFGTPVSTIAPDTTIELSGPNSVITFGGTNLQASLQNNSGTLKLSSGRLFNMTTSYTQSATGILEIGLAPANSYGKLATAGTATLAGTLSVAFVNGFLPVTGNSFDILDWGTLFGTFSTLQLPALEAGLSWDTSQLYTTGVLSVIGSTALPGDFNHDNKVDAADYVMWRKTNGTAAGVNLWRANFGNMAGSGTLSNSTVPEPANASVLLLGAALMYCSIALRTSQIPSAYGFLNKSTDR